MITELSFTDISAFISRLPPLSVPSLSMMSNIFPDAFVIAVVIFATNISVSVMFGKKRGYTVEPNQVRLYYKSLIKLIMGGLCVLKWRGNLGTS